MPPKHSRRSRNAVNDPSPSDTKDAPAQSKQNRLTAGKSTETRPTTKIRANSTATKAEELVSQGPNRLSSLPSEILRMIIDNISHLAAINAFSQTNKAYYALLTPRLYHHIAVGAVYHVQIANIIRKLEPLLTIKQSKQLKKEGKYIGQKTKYPKGLGNEKAPICASYVRQLTLGHADPGKKHEYIVYRYFEEALKNLKNLDVLEVMTWNKSIVESIASLNNLKALSMWAYNAEPELVAPLAGMKNLKHLNIDVSPATLNMAQSIVLNSLSTLESLRLITHTFYGGHCFSEDLASTFRNGSRLSVLKSLQLEYMCIDEEFVDIFPRVIDISKLYELGFRGITDERNLLYPLLTGMMTSYKNSNTTISLQTLSLDMQSRDSPPEPSFSTAQFAFVASFDTLRTLELFNYGEYDPEVVFDNPEIPDAMLQAIFNHKHLKKLHVNYSGIGSNKTLPWLRATKVGQIVDNLPHLSELDFAADDSDADEISRSLLRGRNLETIDMCYYKTWGDGSFAEEQILHSLLSTFLSNANLDADEGQPFIWEEYYKLRWFLAPPGKFEIASSFAKPGRGHKGPEKFEVKLDDGTIRQVYYRRIPRLNDTSQGYDLKHRWLKQVDKALSLPSSQEIWWGDIGTLNYQTVDNY